jgi:hypothetical protein
MMLRLALRLTLAAVSLASGAANPDRNDDDAVRFAILEAAIPADLCAHPEVSACLKVGNGTQFVTPSIGLQRAALERFPCLRAGDSCRSSDPILAVDLVSRERDRVVGLAGFTFDGRCSYAAERNKQRTWRAKALPCTIE